MKPYIPLLISAVSGILALWLISNEDHPLSWVFVFVFVSGMGLAYFVFGTYVNQGLNKVMAAIQTQKKGSGTKKQAESHAGLKKVLYEVEMLGEERKAEIDRLQQLENYRKEFIGNVSHELKTPVFNIQGYLETLLDGGLKDETINQKYLERALNSVNRMIGIIDDLETITLHEAGELELNPEPFDLSLLVKEILESYELKARKKKIDLSLQNTGGSEKIAVGDKKLIRQVISNLVSNSIRYGKESGESKIRLADVGDKIHIEVADNGLGIPEGHQQRVFERFYRVDKSRSREQGGSGLGLSIVKHIIEAHRQEIKLMSTPGAGSVFSFYLAKSVKTGL